MRRTSQFTAAALICLGLAACGGPDQPTLMNIASNTSSPDEFAILPGKPITMPRDLASLPEPTPGGTNRTDQTPRDDAIAALGGRPSRANGPATGGDLIAYASRYGVDPSIRDTLAEEDLEFRRDNNGRVLERLLNVNVYFRAYADQSLDQHVELERFRRAGVRTVSAPPDPLLVGN